MPTFDNIPQELQQLRQWIVWRLEEKPGSAKPTKVPYIARVGCGKASTTDPFTWESFTNACAAPLTSTEIVPWDYTRECPSLTVDETGFTGIGFVFSENDPYTGIDLDDTHGDQEAFARQLKVFQEFNSYSELSPSGSGVHIIIRGVIPQGRRRADIEIYSSGRYFTMTGRVQRDAPIAERQELLTLLFEQMGGPAVTYAAGVDMPQTEDDDTIISRARLAVNGEKFTALFDGDWFNYFGAAHGHQGEGRSEADFALVDMIAFYTQNKEQIRRLYRMSQLAQAPKDGYEHRGDRAAYVEYMVSKSFDRQLPLIDIEGLKLKLMAMGAAATPGGNTAAPDDGAPATPLNTACTSDSVFPPGLLGEVAQFILDASPRPVPQIALAGAIALLSGVTGRAFNVSGTGLNQYVLLLAETGTGKDAIATGISRLMAAVQQSVPAAADFRGPGELVSSAGLIKWLDKKPAVVCVLGEIGLLMQQMAADKANPYLKGLERTMLQMYSKSGKGATFDPSAYSDAKNNTSTIHSPSLTIIGETVPHRFYDALDENVIASGLLPRFLTFEYIGDRGYLNKGSEHIAPPFRLVQGLADLCAQALTLAHNSNCQPVPLDEQSEIIFRDFDNWTTDQINSTRSDILKHLWNRAHLKSLKLAAVCAVGINPTHPLITINETMWATEMVVAQTNKLIAKFEAGEVGAMLNNERAQISEVLKIIGTCITSKFKRYEQYGDTEDMHRDGVFSFSHIQRRCVAVAAFRCDRQGATNAIKRVVAGLIESDELREIPKQQMQAKYGRGPKAYVVADPTRFARAANAAKLPRNSED